ncbi:hypothetical protein [Brevundimonas sp.]|jgi:hypothetical protein|uniref:hypothetical protein n=1 Tax=Brevundimonas sp. TaxID=1871086 RepID=UPI002E164D09|nr:hypothetical protein [Brevundimonas sp.]
MRAILIAVAASFAFAAPAAAEIVSRSENGFTLKFVSSTDIDPADIPTALEDVALWWDGDHSYTGDAANLSLDLSPGGCWCEKMPDGTAFDHGRTVSVAADRIKFSAPFGPLRGKATTADLIVTWPGANRGWDVTWTMVVEGPGVGAMADAVHGVMEAGFQRWVRFLEYGEPHPE